MVCDLSSGRLTAAQALGAQAVVNAKSGDVMASVLDWTAGEGVDLVVDAAGSAATKWLALAALRPGGAAVWIGLHDDAFEISSYGITLPEKQIFGTYAARMDELSDALELMNQGKVDVSTWTETVPLAQAIPAFRRMLTPAEHDIKAVFVP